MKDKEYKIVEMFDAEVSRQSVWSFIDSLQKKLSPLVKEIDIYFSTEGGLVSSGEVFIDYINTLSENYDINLIGTSKILSTGFNIFMKTTTKTKKILPDTVALLHIASAEIETIELVRKEKSSISWYEHKSLIKDNESYINWLIDLGVKIKSIKKIRKGEDVILSNKKINKLLKLNNY